MKIKAAADKHGWARIQNKKVPVNPCKSVAEPGGVSRLSLCPCDGGCPRCTESPPLSDGVQDQIASLKGGGQPMPQPTRDFMESRFNRDFCHVRIHTGARAAEAAELMNAKAFTMGRDVVFGAGRYAPGRPEGRRLLAHELTHVVQQSRHASNKIRCNFATPLPRGVRLTQPALTARQIANAIRYNNLRFNIVGIRMIQRMIGRNPTGILVPTDIQVLADIQEDYGLRKDGKVGFHTLKFLDNERRLEGMPATNRNCLTSFHIILSPQRMVPSKYGAAMMTRHFRIRAQFPRHCRCRDYQYRQFIRGHFRVERIIGGHRIIRDESHWFRFLPAGRLLPQWREDGDTSFPMMPFYGHRNNSPSPDDKYVNDSGGLDMVNGCRYRGYDPHGGNNYRGTPGFHPTTGDIIDISISFRGEIQRNGRAVRRKYWRGLHGRFRVP